MSPGLENFVLNLRFLIGLLLFLAILFAVTVAVWTGVKILVFRVRQRRAQEEARRRTCGQDGRHIPPLGEGMCERCQCVFDEVYHLPSGGRLCPECYKEAGAG